MCRKSYQIYQSIGYGYGSRTKPYLTLPYLTLPYLTKVSGTGIMYSYVIPSLPKCQVREGPSMDACTRTRTRTRTRNRNRTRPPVFQQGRTRYQGILPRAYRTYQSAGYGWIWMSYRTYSSAGYGWIWMSYQAYQRVGYGWYGCFTKLTKESGMVRLLIAPVPVPDPRFFSKAVRGTRVFYCGRAELTKVSGAGRVWESYQAYQSVRYG